VPNTVPAADVAALIAAIRDALNIPLPASHMDWDAYRDLLSSRTAYMVGVLAASAAGAPLVGSEIRTLREIGQTYPVRYEVAS
jgi:hypothetical protein